MAEKKKPGSAAWFGGIRKDTLPRQKLVLRLARPGSVVDRDAAGQFAFGPHHGLAFVPSARPSLADIPRFPF